MCSAFFCVNRIAQTKKRIQAGRVMITNLASSPEHKANVDKFAAKLVEKLVEARNDDVEKAKSMASHRLRYQHNF